MVRAAYALSLQYDMYGLMDVMIEEIVPRVVPRLKHCTERDLILTRDELRGMCKMDKPW